MSSKLKTLLTFGELCCKEKKYDFKVEISSFWDVNKLGYAILDFTFLLRILSGPNSGAQVGKKNTFIFMLFKLICNLFRMMYFVVIKYNENFLLLL